MNHFGQVEAVLVPKWFNGVDCKSIIRRFESDPALKVRMKKIMTTREIVARLEIIEEKLSKSESVTEECEMIAELIDSIIEDDLKFETFLEEIEEISEAKLFERLFKLGLEMGYIAHA